MAFRWSLLVFLFKFANGASWDIYNGAKLNYAIKMNLTKKQILDAVIEAHEIEKKRCEETAKTFKDRKSFPQVSEEQLLKAARIVKALEVLRSFSNSPVKNCKLVAEGLVLRALNSIYGEQFYFFFKQPEIPFVSISQKITVAIVDAGKFNPRKVGEIRIHQQGRSGEEFEVHNGS